MADTDDIDGPSFKSTAGPVTPAQTTRPCDERLQVRFPERARQSGIPPSDLRARGARRPRAQLDHYRLHWVRLHRSLAACRLAAADHDALLDAADRSSSNCPDG